MNQVIRIIFDDPIPREYADFVVDRLNEWLKLGDHAAIEVYEEEFKDEEDKNGKTKKEKPN